MIPQWTPGQSLRMGTEIQEQQKPWVSRETQGGSRSEDTAESLKWAPSEEPSWGRKRMLETRPRGRGGAERRARQRGGAGAGPRWAGFRASGGRRCLSPPDLQLR